MLLPPGKFFSMFHFLEYPFSRGSTHIVSPNPYEAPDFDAGFMNDARDMAPMVWAYKKSRETARRMDCFAGEVMSMHPHFAYDSPARCFEMDLETTKAYAGPNHLSAGIQHGSWARPLEKYGYLRFLMTWLCHFTDSLYRGKPAQANFVTSNQTSVREDIVYSKEDDEVWKSLATLGDDLTNTIKGNCRLG